MENVMTAVRINASERQYSPAGFLLWRMYDSRFLERVLNKDEYCGHTHDGGEHTLYLRLRAQDVESFLTLAQEEFSGSEGVAEFVASVHGKFQKV